MSQEDKEIAGVLKAFQRARSAGGGKAGMFHALSQDKELNADDRRYYLRRYAEMELNKWDFHTYMKVFFAVLGWALFEVLLLLVATGAI